MKMRGYVFSNCCEFSQGATFNRGFNRALGSLLAGILAIAVVQLALRTGRVAEPIIIGFSIFFIGISSMRSKLYEILFLSIPVLLK